MGMALAEADTRTSAGTVPSAMRPCLGIRWQRARLPERSAFSLGCAEGRGRVPARAATADVRRMEGMNRQHH